MVRSVDRFGRLDVLFNNAGLFRRSRASRTRPTTCSTASSTSTSKVFYGCRAAIPHLKAQGGGVIGTLRPLASAHGRLAVYNASRRP